MPWFSESSIAYEKRAYEKRSVIAVHLSTATHRETLWYIRILFFSAVRESRRRFRCAWVRSAPKEKKMADTILYTLLSASKLFPTDVDVPESGPWG